MRLGGRRETNSNLPRVSRAFRVEFESSSRRKVAGTRSNSDREALYWRLLPVVDAALRRVITRQDHEYEDLLQSALEAVLAALRKDSFRGDSSLSTWVTKIARNIAIDVLRTRSRERRVFAHGAETDGVVAGTRSPGPSPERLVEVREQLIRYHEVLRKLPSSKVQIVYLYDVVGLGLEEIAKSLSLSVAATQSRLVRGRKEVDDRIAAMDRRRSISARGGAPPLRVLRPPPPGAPTEEPVGAQERGGLCAKSCGTTAHRLASTIALHRSARSIGSATRACRTCA
jgi:RNA polymerase sigma factor (sigma-70 family)